MSPVTAIAEHFPYLGLFLLLILGGMGLPFPEDATLILCGFLISNGIVRPIPALLVAYAGLLLSDFLLFSVGSRYGRLIVQHPRFRKIISSERLAAIEARFRKRGVLLIIIGRHLAGLRAQLFLAAGVMRMPPLKFLAADAGSSLITMALMVGAGYAGGSSLEVLTRDITRIEHMAVVAGVAALFIGLFYRHFRGRRGKTPG